LAQGFRPSDFVGFIPLGVAPVGLTVSTDGRFLYATSHAISKAATESGGEELQVRENGSVSDDQERFMREALAVARIGLETGEMPIGAVVVVDGEIVTTEHTKEHSAGRLLVHADLLALDMADRVLAGRCKRATLYVNLEPCLMCLGAAFTAKVGSIVYGLESPIDGGVAAFESWERGSTQRRHAWLRATGPSRWRSPRGIRCIVQGICQDRHRRQLGDEVAKELAAGAGY
jgi:tRNA(Arg) A34 adenosine deaminase TadA